MFLPPESLVLVRGGGEMGSGVAWRLSRCGYQVIISETTQPTAIRRWVCFSEAVYEGTTNVEGVVASHCERTIDITQALESRHIAVVVAPDYADLKFRKPDVVVDAMLMKLGGTTPRGNAALTIGLGPGFVAGADVDCVIETNRGADLGRCLWAGSAEANTSVPGLLGGETARRVLRAPCPGVVQPTVDIGQIVDSGDVVAQIGNTEVRAQINGIVRGMLRPGHTVAAGTKIGDIDPRGDVEICRRISDKALAIAGGVLEAILTSR